jgi:hypothetical protein
MFNKLKEFVFGKPKAESLEPVAPYKVEPPVQPAVEVKKLLKNQLLLKSQHRLNVQLLKSQQNLNLLDSVSCKSVSR